MNNSYETCNGNSFILYSEKNADITGIYSPEECACFCRLEIENAHEPITEPLSGGGKVHKLFLDGLCGDSALPGARITDMCVEGLPAFIRRICSTEELRIRISSPSYVRRAHFASYRIGSFLTDTLLLIIPSGSNYYEDIASSCEERLLIAVRGCAVISVGGIDIKPGVSDIVFIAGKDSAVMLKTAADVLRICEKRSNDHMLPPKYPASGTAAYGEERELAEALFSKRRRGGSVTGSPACPLFGADSFAPLVKAFDSLGKTEYSADLVRYYLELYGDDARFSTFSTPGGRTVMQDADEAGAAASVLEGLCAYYRSREITAKAHKVMKRALGASLHSLFDNVAGFSGLEPELEAGMIPPDCMLQGSGENTMKIILACRDYFELTKGRAGAKTGAEPGDLIGRMRESFEELFCRDGMVCLNANVPVSRKRRRFISGRCMICRKEGAPSPVTALEKGKGGGYLCPKCLESGKRYEILPADPVPSVFLTAKALENSLLGRDNAVKAEKLLKEYADKYVSSPETLPLRRFAQDIAVLRALEKLGYDMKKYCRTMLGMLPPGKLCTALVCGTRFIGTAGDSGAQAELLTLLREDKGFSDEQ